MRWWQNFFDYNMKLSLSYWCRYPCLSLIKTNIKPSKFQFHRYDIMTEQELNYWRSQHQQLLLVTLPHTRTQQMQNFTTSFRGQILVPPIYKSTRKRFCKLPINHLLPTTAKPQEISCGPEPWIACNKQTIKTELSLGLAITYQTILIGVCVCLGSIKMCARKMIDLWSSSATMTRFIGPRRCRCRQN